MTNLFNKNGTRNAAGRLLATIAMYNRGMSFADEETQTVQKLAKGGLVTVVIDRATVTEAGRNALA